MSTLPDLLADLVDVPGAVAPSTPPADLWARGRAAHRRRRVGSAVVVALAVVLLGLLGTVTWVREPHVQPAPADAPAGLPDRLYVPSPWLPGTRGSGPLGPLAGVLVATRSSLLHDDPLQPVGVSATTGAYRFLDLPDLAPSSLVSQRWVLAPDGHHLAYWTSGRVSGTSKPEVTGVAVYDPGTGRVRRHALPGAFGVSPVGLVWAGDDTVVIGAYTRVDDSGAGRSGPALVWDLSAAAPHAAALSAAGLYPGGPGFVVTYGRRFETVDVRSGRPIRSFPKLGGFGGEPAADPTGRRIAVVPGSQPLPVVVLSAGTGAAGGISDVPGSRGAASVLGWSDPQHVAVLGPLRSTVSDSPDATVVVIDTATGQSRVVTRVDDGAVAQIQLATDLLAEPTVPTATPPRPLSHRLVAGLGVTVVLGGLLLLIGWRRRARP